MTDKWSITIYNTPEFNPHYPTDPVDWEAYLECGTEVIYVTFTGIIQADGETIRPWPQDKVEARLKAMAEGLSK